MSGHVLQGARLEVGCGPSTRVDWYVVFPSVPSGRPATPCDERFTWSVFCSQGHDHVWCRWHVAGMQCRYLSLALGTAAA